MTNRATKKRTSHFVIFLRFYLICLPFGLLMYWIASLAGNHGNLAFLVFNVTIVLFWQFLSVFVNAVHRIGMGKKDHKEMRSTGYHPFYDTTTAPPLNFDTYEVRFLGLMCPYCLEELTAPPYESTQCQNCGLYWDGSNWFQWNGHEWAWFDDS